MPTKSLKVPSRSEPYQHKFDDVGRDVLWCAIQWFNFKAEFSNITTKMSDSLYVWTVYVLVFLVSKLYSHTSWVKHRYLTAYKPASSGYTVALATFFIPAVAACLKQGRIGNAALPKGYMLVQIKEMRHCVPARELYRSWWVDYVTFGENQNNGFLFFTLS